jgi:hypothetical protein
MRCHQCSEDGTIRAWTAKIEESEAEIDIEDLPEELRGAAVLLECCTDT